MRVNRIGLIAGGALAVAAAGAALLAAGAATAQSAAQPQPVRSTPIPVSSRDRVYTADQTSNTVTVIDPSTDKVLGTIALGAQRLSTTLNPQYLGDENVHGLAFSDDHRKLAVVSIGSDTVDIVDTATNKVLNHTDVGRASHEGWFTRDGKQFWVADRGRDTVTIVDAVHGGVVTDLNVGANPSKVVMSPDGKLAYVNHLTEAEITVVDVASHRVVDHITGLGDAFSSDLAISPDGAELWVPHKRAGLTTVVDLVHRKVKTVLKTGPDTNHPNFAGQYAYVTVGGLDKTVVYKRSSGNPALVGAIQDNGHAPHGVWPSGDGSRLYIGLEKSDAVDVVDTATNKVIDTIAVGQEPQALVYVPDAAPNGGAPNLGRQGLGQQAHNVPTTLPDGTPGDTMDPVKGRALEATIRPVAGLDMIDLQARGLRPSTTYQAYGMAADGTRTKVVTFATDGNGNAPQVLAFAQFDGTSVAIVPIGGTERPVSTADDAQAVTAADLFYCDCCC
ncbi:beta-propeller fold lactonase family protein [Kutzneria sp. CA-103260]|uniref:beta-propeller fold lactonase family protein n=1 Tax=Kutzneria sp. CA-103260 TaxID=2802641 RepID=UPI001BA8C9F8|nr:beta-propeller fold lactonase family protein [Kutzneria sp. CA-103260]QUQ64361.1 Lactonase, 7-bladed beta-propeller [Kutzneria sp. CA-103260]